MSSTKKHSGRDAAGQAPARSVPGDTKEGAAPAGDQPRSWRQYIEEAEAAEKQAEREAQRVRAAQIKKEKRRPRLLRERAPAAPNRAPRDRRPRRELPKEWAAQAAKALAAAGGRGWERICALTAGGWDCVGRAASGIRGVVARHPISPLLYVTLLTVFIGVVAFKDTYARAYVLQVNGQEMGLVAGQEDVDAIRSNIESRASNILGEHYDYDPDISMTPVYVAPAALSDTTQIEEALFEDVGALVTAYGLRVNGAELGYAPDSSILYQMLDEVAQPYLTPNTVSYNFVETVEVYSIELPSNTQYNVDSIRSTLSTLRVQQATYTVEKGDTFNAIAYSLGMMPNDLSVLNPDVLVDKIWVGQELVIQQSVPYLSVENITDEVYDQVIPSPVEYTETAELYVGDTKVWQEGEDGLEQVSAHVTYVNGVEVAREVLYTETLKEPTTTYAYTGTTPRPVTASNGYFIWPVRGTITSNFGGRNLWGSYDFHLGLDIACRTGTAIKAADGGTVIKSGWSGSYGYLVAIRHDNGYVTYYAHNSQLLVSVGQKVYQGQIIARSGATGNVSGPHCHFEVRINGTSVNPRNYLR
ncbi:MAG: peptidoglycan DD-metalloendopeptidase family protein [Oscillospiraceae bacterium]|nr:peptidoglycan DD-metalloendopeptidase family protein [Oscillospiraceae bacterium]